MFIWSADVSSTSQTWTPKLLHKFNDVVWHLSWSVTGNILAVSGGDNKVLLSGSDMPSHHATFVSWSVTGNILAVSGVCLCVS